MLGDVKQAIANLSNREKDIQLYDYIMSNYESVKITEDALFQKKFNGLYRIRYGEEWRREYYSVFEDCKRREQLSFEFILKELFARVGRVEASFSSKMLATLNPTMPIWDSKICKAIGISPSNKRGWDKINETIVKYDKIVQWYQDFVNNEELCTELVKEFDNRFPDYMTISIVKKIDFVIWAMPDDRPIANEETKQKQFKEFALKKLDMRPVGESLSERYSELAETTKYISSIFSEYQDISDNLTKNILAIRESIAPIANFQKEIVDSITPFLERMRAVFEEIHFSIPMIKLSENLLKSLANINYINILREIQWPLFLEDDESLHDLIVSAYSKDNHDQLLEDIGEEICKYYTSEKIGDILSKWKQLTVEQNRMKLLEEGIFLHNEGCYFGSVAVFICQIDGLINDIAKFADENGFSVNEDDERFICEELEIKYEEHVSGIKKKREKHKMIRLMLYPQSGYYYWQAVTDYIYHVVLTSDDNSLKKHNPLRNKICHGEQVDFGTKEHSLKVIFVVDLLLNLYMDLSWIINNQA